jgi:hypothetical protein
MAPQRVGLKPWRMRYEVMVRLIAPVDTCKSLAIVGIAGVYRFELSGLNRPTIEAIETIIAFCRELNLL